MQKILFTLITFFAFSLMSYAQSAKAEARAEDKTEKLAEWIEAGDKSVALSDAQKKEIEELYAEMRMEINKLKKDYPDKGGDFEEKRKEISKKYSKMVNKDVLTKEQRKAKRKGKEMLEEQ